MHLTICETASIPCANTCLMSKLTTWIMTMVICPLTSCWSRSLLSSPSVNRYEVTMTWLAPASMYCIALSIVTPPPSWSPPGYALSAPRPAALQARCLHWDPRINRRKSWVVPRKPINVWVLNQPQKCNAGIDPHHSSATLTDVWGPMGTYREVLSRSSTSCV